MTSLQCPRTLVLFWLVAAAGGGLVACGGRLEKDDGSADHANEVPDRSAPSGQALGPGIVSFSVTPVSGEANAGVNFNVALTCVDNSLGDILIPCAVVVDSFGRYPRWARIGNYISVGARGHDPQGVPISYLWSNDDPAVGSFVDARAADTLFGCLGLGTDIRISVTLSNGQCSQTLEESVDCRKRLD